MTDTTNDGGETPEINEELATQYKDASIPEKFWRPSWEETTRVVASGYSELEKHLGKGKPADDPEPSPGADPDPPGESDENSPLTLSDPPVDTDDLDSVIRAANLDVNDLATKWGEKGSLDDADYEALKAANPAYSKSVVDRIARGMAAEADLQRVQQTQVRGKAAELVGGDEQLDSLLSWAKENLDANTKNYIEPMLQDPLTATAAVEMLAKYRGDAPESPAHGTVPPPSGGAFKTRAEFYEANNKLQSLLAQGKTDAALARRILDTDESSLT